MAAFPGRPGIRAVVLVLPETGLPRAGVGDWVAMTAVSGGTGPGGRWDVALSFAGAQRDYVGQVAVALKARGVRCFYDEDEQVRLWGTYLAEELPRIYAEESAAVVVFISAEYAGRDWTRLERRVAFSRAVAEAGVFVLPARFDDSELPGLLPDVVTVDLRRYTPAQFADLVMAKLADLGISASLVAGTERAPTGAVRVSQTDPRRLGVHAAISVPGVPDEVLPEYVPRDVDAAGSGVRARVAAAAEHGGFVLLVGGSSVGKTRCAAEAVRALLPDWWLVHPAGPGEVAALAVPPPGRVVVWLDELQRYLDGEHGLSGGTVRALLGAPGPVVLIATLWPDRYHAYTAVPASGGADPRGREREVLELAAVIRIAEEFSAAEQGQARAAAARDRRLALALGAAGYGLTQTLAAAPQLVARWQDARAADPYAWAVLTAALDVTRLGGRAPLSADLLRAAAPGYCTSAQQAEAPGNWFERALAYATEKLHGAAAALSPAGDGVMGWVAGYTVADYLLQHATRERRSVRVPASTWDALLSDIRDPADAARLAGSAEDRLLYRYAIPLYRHAVGAADYGAATRLAGLLVRREDLDGAAQVLLPFAHDDRGVAVLLALLQSEQGDLDELRARADAGDWSAAGQLLRLLAMRGDLDELRARADAGDWDAAMRLNRLLAERGDLDELRARADAGDWSAAGQLARLLAMQGDLDELRARADAGDWSAARRLAGLLVGRGDLDEAVQILRPYADNKYAARLLARLLAMRGDLDELRARADADDTYAAGLLAEREDQDETEQILRFLADTYDPFADGLRARRGGLDELRARAEADDADAAGLLADLLAERGELDESEQILRAQADVGDGDAYRLAKLLAQRGQGEEAELLRRFGLNPDGSIACG